MLPRILLVDDLESNLFLLEKYIEKLAVEIDTCMMPKQVEHLVAINLYSLIILDIQMPDLDGYELASIIQRTELNKHTPIIFITGVFNDNESIVKAYQSGAVDFISKPVNRAVLVSKIKIFLELFNQKKELQQKSVLLEQYIDKLKKSEKKKLRYMIEGEDKERERLSRELHDGLGQFLSAASLNLGSIRDEIKDSNLSSVEKFEAGYDLIKKAIDESRNITRRLIPKSVSDFGLFDSINSLVNTLNKSSEVSFKFLSNLNEKRLNKNAETNLYRISQECFNNAIKHSKAKEVILQIFLRDDILSLTYEDNGVGFDIDEYRGEYDSYGLQNMNNRAQLMNGNFQIDSNLNKGIFISIEIPAKNVSV